LLTTKRPSAEVFRIARRPDPWQPPDWSCASADGTFGNRFDDPEGYYRVLYASSQKLSCFVETLARFRPDLSLLAEFQDVEEENDFFPLGHVPPEWCDGRLLGTAKDFDASTLHMDAPRRITQLVSRHVYELGLPGIYYRSRLGHDCENWALFEPFRLTPKDTESIATSDSDLLRALDLLGLKLG
jgi:hypothetical protein